MLQSKKMKEFVETVCGQVKAKGSHGSLSNELRAHIEDQKSAYMKNGMDEGKAEEKAIEQMGDPVSVGQSLNQIHRSSHDWIGIIANVIMCGIAGIIVLTGVIAGVVSATAIVGSGTYIIGIIIGAGFAAGSIIISFVFVSIWKFIANMLFYYGLAKDYERRKKRGQIYGKY